MAAKLRRTIAPKVSHARVSKPDHIIEIDLGGGDVCTLPAAFWRVSRKTRRHIEMVLCAALVGERLTP
jgi:hypothetical protein